jgi:hypothetical protein
MSTNSKVVQGRPVTKVFAGRSIPKQPISTRTVAQPLNYGKPLKQK